MIELKYQIEKPSDVLMTVHLTATVGEFRQLCDQLGEKYPSWEFASDLRKAIATAEKTYSLEHEAK